MPVTTGPKSILREAVGQHIASFLVTQNEALSFPQALASLTAATATYCLGLKSPMPEWAKVREGCYIVLVNVCQTFGIICLHSAHSGVARLVAA